MHRVHREPTLFFKRILIMEALKSEFDFVMNFLLGMKFERFVHLKTVCFACKSIYKFFIDL